MPLLVAPGAKNACISWPENLHGRRSLGHRDMEWPIIYPCDQRGAFQERGQLTYRRIRDDERGRLHTPGDLFQQRPLVFASSQDDTGWWRECQVSAACPARIAPQF